MSFFLCEGERFPEKDRQPSHLDLFLFVRESSRKFSLCISEFLFILHFCSYWNPRRKTHAILPPKKYVKKTFRNV